MNEHEYFKQMIRDRAVNDAVVKATAKMQTKRSVAWRKPLAIAAATFAVLVGTVFLIPKARAEVLSWFTPRNTGDYVATDPEIREPVEEIDSMIMPPETSVVDIHVNYVADEPYWREIGENFSASFGETIYDGKNISIVIDFDGLSGYPVYEGRYSPDVPAGTSLPTLLAEKLDPEMVKCFREDYADVSMYLDGSMEQWNGPESRVELTLEDGTRFSRTWNVVMQKDRPRDKAFYASLQDVIYQDDVWTEEEAEMLRTSVWEYIKANGLRAVAEVYLPNPEEDAFEPDSDRKFADCLDENGNLKLHVRYIASIDHGEETETKLDVDLGTVVINMTAYKDMKQRRVEAEQSEIALSGDAVIGRSAFDAEQYYSVTNYPMHLDGVTLRVTQPGTVDMLGVHHLGVLVSMPKDWSVEQKEIFARNLFFDVEIDGEAILGGASLGWEPRSSGNWLIQIDLEDIPFDRISTMQSITLTPTLQYCTEAIVQRTLPDGSLETVRTVPIGEDGTFDTRTLERGTPVLYHHEETAHPEWAITLKVQ